MQRTERPEFAAILSRTFRALGHAAPDKEILEVWWQKLEPFPLEAVAAAFSKHVDESEFAPKPAAILKHLRAGGDGRPEPDEAWAIALPARDERESVVWTDEIAAAFATVRPVLANDEIGARFAFRAAYARLIENARTAAVPVRWTVSQGFDAERRITVMQQAVREGRLALPDARAAVPLIASADATAGTDARANAQIAHMHDVIADITARRDARLAESAAKALAERDATAHAKDQAARAVEDYKERHQ